MFKNPPDKDRNSNSYKQRNHAHTVLVLLGILLILSFIIPLTSCSGLIAPDEKIDVEEAEETSASAEAPEEISEETMALEEEDVPEIDYQNATIGAEMEGAIPTFLCTNRDNYIKIRVTNTSDFTWRDKRPGVVRIGYHYYGQDVDYVDYDGTQRTVLPRAVEPGETIMVIVLVNDVINPGNYVIQLDPVLEGNERPEDNFWFSSKGVEMIQGPVFFGECGASE